MLKELFPRYKRTPLVVLSIGTFLEYFDLSLYVHMAVLLNEIFLPKADTGVETVIIASAFCSNYLLRPFGALIFGYISDNYGRRTTIVITTTMMAISCLVIANLPTYAQIGISAAWIVTFCRIFQGMASQGELVASQVYIAETNPPPIGYFYVNIVGLNCVLGGVVALGFATLLTKYGLSWRIAFWSGAFVAVIGAVARTRLLETSEFTELAQTSGTYKDKTKMNILRVFKVGIRGDITKEDNKKIRFGFKESLAFFCVSFGWPVTFYLVYIYFIPTLKSFGYTPADIIQHNFFLSLVSLVVLAFLSVLSYLVNPLKIVRYRACIFLVLMIVMPFAIEHCQSPSRVFLLQSCAWLGSLTREPASYILFKFIPTYRRVTTSSVLYAISSLMIYLTTAFGLTYLTKWFGSYGPSILGLPLAVCGLISVNHFLRLQKRQDWESSQNAVFG